MSPATVFERNFEFHQLPSTLKLRNLDWGVYFSTDGIKTTGELRAHFRLESSLWEEVLTRLLQMELIREKKLALVDHIHAVALNTDVQDSQVRSLDEFIRTGSTDRAPSTTPVSSPARTASGTGHSPAVFAPLPPPAKVKTMSLLSVMRFILDQTRDKTAGQLAVYRVFMGVDTKLLKKNGIQSLRFQEDRLITDQELQQAITENISKSFRKTLPDTVYVAS